MLWHQESGALPDGITLQPDGQLTGTPTKAGTYTVTVSAHFADGTNHASDSTTYSITVIDEIPPCNDPDVERAVIFDNAQLYRMDPVTGTAVGLDPSRRLVIYRDGTVTTTGMTDVAPVSISSDGRWVLSYRAIPSGGGQPGVDLINLDTLQRHPLPTGGDHYYVYTDVNDAGSVTGLRAPFDEDGQLNGDEQAIVVPLGSGVTVLAAPTPSENLDAYLGRGILPDGSILGSVGFHNEAENTYEFGLLHWSSPSASPTYLDPSHPTAGSGFVIAVAPTVPAHHFTTTSNESVVLTTEVVLADGSSYPVSHAPKSGFWWPDLLLDSGALVQIQADGDQVGGVTIYTPDGTVIDATPPLRVGEQLPSWRFYEFETGFNGSSAPFGLTDDGVMYASVEDASGKVITFRCLPPSE